MLKLLLIKPFKLIKPLKPLNINVYTYFFFQEKNMTPSYMDQRGYEPPHDFSCSEGHPPYGYGGGVSPSPVGYYEGGRKLPPLDLLHFRMVAMNSDASLFSSAV